jgi:glycosyltransferase involved in cell wall biosynthesis
MKHFPMKSAQPSAPRLFPALPAPVTPATGRRVRVCIASPEFVGPSQNGGIGTAYTALADALADAGHEVTCLYLLGTESASHDIQYWVRQFRQRRLKLVPLPRLPTPIDAPWHQSKSYETYTWLKQHDEFDVIHFPEWRGPGFHTLNAKHQGLAFARSTICVGTHSMTAWLKTANRECLTELDELEQDFMERQSVALADVVVSPSSYLLNWIAQRGWLLPTNCHVQQNVLPKSARPPGPVPPRALHEISELVFFGRLETRKGVLLFCDALDRIPAELAKKLRTVTFLGKEANVEGVPGCQFVQKRAERWPWKVQVLTDRNQPQAIAYLSQKGRLAAIPSLLENSPYTVLECLGAGIAFVANRIGGIPELIAPEDVDKVCFETKPEALAQLLCTALQDGFRAAQPALDALANERAWVAWHENQCADASAITPAAVAPAARTWPKVSLCLTTFNRPKLLGQALESIKALTYPNFEVVLVDDGSTKPEAVTALQALESDFAARGWRIVRQPNRYLGAARNSGARQASGDYLLFMDDDNYAEPGELTTLVEVAGRTGADIVCCGMNYFNGYEAPQRQHPPKGRWLPLGGAAAVGAFKNCFGDANALVRRSSFVSLGGFTEDFGVTHEDWEFHANAVLRGYKLEVVPEFLFWYRGNADSMIRTLNWYPNYMRSIRPYLNAVPEELRNLVYFAQGLQMRHGTAQARSAALTEFARLTIPWRSKLEAARVLATLNQPKAAEELLRQAIKVAEGTKHPVVVLEAILGVAEEMRRYDRAQAQHLAELAVQLADILKDPTLIEKAHELKTSCSSTERRPDVGAVAPALSAAIGLPPVTPKRTVGFLAFEPPDHACPTLRLKSVLEHLHGTGSLELVPLGGLRDGHFHFQEHNLQRAEIIVVQRQMAAALPYAELRKRLNGRPAKVVFELDDALTLLPESHRAVAAFRQIRPHIEEYLRQADLITVSTPALQSLFQPLNRNIAVLSNSVDTGLWSPPSVSQEPADRITILFSGTLDHERDLQVVEPALLDLLAAFPDQVEFLYWGNVTERLRALPQVKSVGAFLPSYQEYAARLQQLAVSFALVPLEDIPFNRGKSAIKWLEYSACRIPGIYSELAAYPQTVKHGRTGLLVPNTREAWFSAMKTLVENRALRHDLGAQAQADGTGSAHGATECRALVKGLRSHVHGGGTAGGCRDGNCTRSLNSHPHIQPRRTDPPVPVGFANEHAGRSFRADCGR